MPVLGNALRDISDAARVPGPGVYGAQITEVEDTKSRSNKDMTVVTVKLQGGEFDGYELKDYYVTEGKTPGTYNETGLRNLKRTSTALVGDRATEDDFDTAELVGMDVSILISSDSFEDTELKQHTGIVEKIQTARIKRFLGAR